MRKLNDRTRIQAAQADADRHGYHIAYANPLAAEEEESWGGFLCYGSSAADAAEAGAEIIRRSVELEEPWPEELLGAHRGNRTPPEAA